MTQSSNIRWLNKHTARVSDQLLEAYCQTYYQLSIAGQTIELQVGKPCADLERLFGHAFGAVITAVNPLSQALSDDENERRQQQLQQALTAYAQCWPAAAVDPQQQWPTEQGFFVLDIKADELLGLAQLYQQHAVVAWQSGEPAQLWVLSQPE
ncbi:hypothetical protein CWI84_08465 [Idiomarina tyrosinivorans]|uniref:DUF3293 domain-containing protein n=1 Tax=Idiomarina tyrosinivorans TaxID=1445662 RepID=A0A432ZQ05_9GAMM|nr:DUF3293 domain-containing protein [Idiomarina tyrosinivorans]RUO79984.1 hypothetical protein CWI84_08465 [Idiomarina tyrosinivorans]